MPKTTTKTQISIKVNINPVKLADVTPAQRQLVKKFWTRLIAQVRDEVKQDGKATT